MFSLALVDLLSADIVGAIGCAIFGFSAVFLNALRERRGWSKKPTRPPAAYFLMDATDQLLGTAVFTWWAVVGDSGFRIVGIALAVVSALLGMVSLSIAAEVRRNPEKAWAQLAKKPKKPKTATEAGRTGPVAIPAETDTVASPSDRTQVIPPPAPLGDLPPTHTRPGWRSGWVIVGLCALTCAIAVVVVLGSAHGGPAVSTRTSVQARPRVRAKQARDVYVDELSKGACLARPIPEGDVSTVKVGPCSQPHREEVYAIFNLPPGHYDGQGMVDHRGDAGCEKRFANYVGIDYDSSALDYFAVTPDASDLGDDRRVLCVAVDNEHTGTSEGVRR